VLREAQILTKSQNSNPRKYEAEKPLCSAVLTLAPSRSPDFNEVRTGGLFFNLLALTNQESLDNRLRYGTIIRPMAN
jgi:hypothetical protein